MAFNLADRVRETSVTTGTGALALAGAVTGYRRFGSVLSVGDTTFYAIVLGSDFETGIATYSAADTLTRTSIYESSNGGAAVSFASGVKNVFITLPAKAYAAPPSKSTGALLRALADDATFVTPKSMADAMGFVADAGVTGTYAPDIATGFNRVASLTGNVTLGQFANLKDGEPIVLMLVQDATGGRTLAVNTTVHKFAGGTVPTLSTAANAIDRLSGICRLRASTLVVEWASLEKAFSA